MNLIDKYHQLSKLISDAVIDKDDGVYSGLESISRQHSRFIRLGVCEDEVIDAKLICQDMEAQNLAAIEAASALLIAHDELRKEGIEFDYQNDVKNVVELREAAGKIREHCEAIRELISKPVSKAEWVNRWRASHLKRLNKNTHLFKRLYISLNARHSILSQIAFHSTRSPVESVVSDSGETLTIEEIIKNVDETIVGVRDMIQSHNEDIKHIRDFDPDFYYRIVDFRNRSEKLVSDIEVVNEQIRNCLITIKRQQFRSVK